MNICRLIGEFNSFAFKVITDNEGFFSAIVEFVFYVISFFPSIAPILPSFVFDGFFFLMHHFESLFISFPVSFIYFLNG